MTAILCFLYRFTLLVKRQDDAESSEVKTLHHEVAFLLNGPYLLTLSMQHSPA